MSPWAVCQASIGCALPGQGPVEVERVKVDEELITIVSDEEMATEIAKALELVSIA